MSFRRAVLMCACLTPCVLLPGVALASVADLRALVADRPELVYHWTFEGRFVREAMRDERSRVSLQAVAYPGGASAEPSLSEPGPDSTSRCLRIVRKSAREGIAARSLVPVRFEREGTAELLFRADSVTPGEFNKGWMLHTSGASRLYLGGVSHIREVDEVIAGFGNAQPFHPKAEVVIAGGADQPGLEIGRWYYLAVTYSHDRRTGEFLVNAYLGPVGSSDAGAADGVVLVHTVKDARRPGGREALGERVLNLGSAGPEQILDGAVDEVALYDRPLSPEVLEEHYAALSRPAGPEDTVNLDLMPQAPVFQVSSDLARRHAGAYTTEWQHTSPDLVVFLPPAESGPQAENQHFIVFPLSNGDFFAVWTTAYHESHPNQHVVFSKSTDRGVTWTEPVTIAGPQVVEKNGGTTYEGLASWGFPIYVAAKNRIYVFYNKGLGVYDPRPGFSGEMRFRYTDDAGGTWSREYTLGFRRVALDSPDRKVPPNWIIWQQPVEITPGQVIGCGTIWSGERLAREQPDAPVGSECFFWRFDNILTEDDPEKLRVTLLPDGDHGIRMPTAAGSRESIAEEPTVVRLSDGRWFCVFRSYTGAVGYAVSQDEGHTWSEARPLLYQDGGEPVAQPVASCPLYRLADGRFLITFHNNSGRANGAAHPWDWRWNRTPAFLSVGREKLDADQPVWFGKPVMLLDNEAKPWGPSGRTSVAVYTSFFEFGDKRWYWYPDRKHFLLGKIITDELL